MCPVPSTGYSNPGKEAPISNNTTFDIEAHRFDIVYGYRKNNYRYREIFDIGIYRYQSFGLRYRRFFDIGMNRYRYKMIRYQLFFDIVVDRYRVFKDLDRSISNVQIFDIEFNIVSRYRRSFSDARYRLNIVIYRYRMSDARYRVLPRFQMP